MDMAINLLRGRRCVHPLPGRRFGWPNLPRGAVRAGLGNCCRISAHKAGIAVGEIQRKEIRLLLNRCATGDFIVERGRRSPPSPRRNPLGRGQRHKHLPTAPDMFPAIVLNRRIAALERVFVTQPLKKPFGSVPLLAVPAEIFLRQRVDKASEAIALWPLDLNRSLITGWCRTQHHLRHARTQYPKMAHCRPFTHAAPTCEADLL